MQLLIMTVISNLINYQSER